MPFHDELIKINILHSQSLIWLGGIFWPLQLHLEPLGADLVAVHGLDGGVGRLVGGEGHKAKALGQVGLLVNEHLGGDDGAEGLERLAEVRVSELLGEETIIIKKCRVLF